MTVDIALLNLTIRVSLHTLHEYRPITVSLEVQAALDELKKQVQEDFRSPGRFQQA